MINPSIHGWIDKFFMEQKPYSDLFPADELDFYTRTRKTGFIFGHIIDFDVEKPIVIDAWFPIEVSKLGLLNTLFQTYRFVKKSNHQEDFILKAHTFYKEIKPKSFNLLKKVLPSNTASIQLEELIHERVQTSDDLISKNFSNLVTNALLFADILAFKQYLEKGNIPEKYSLRIEEVIISVVSLSLKSKTGISIHDELLQKLVENSVRYTKYSSSKTKTIDDLDLSYLENVLEKYYVIDLAGLSLWSDEKVENEERYFLYTLGKKLEIEESIILESIDFVNSFISAHKDEIPYFNDVNPVKHFYDQTTENVSVLINRNKKRLIKELSQSKELMYLLAQSTKRDLDKEEKRKVKNQLLDICKSVPSLTIFLLPGGTLLLPLLIKFIPKMLPSAFNENIDD